MKKLTTFSPPKPLVKPFDEGSGEFHQFATGRDDVKLIAEMDNGSVIVIQVKDDRKPAARGILVTPSGGHGRLAEDETERVMRMASKEQK